MKDVFFFGKYMGDMRAIYHILEESGEYNIYYDFYDKKVSHIPDVCNFDLIITSHQNPPERYGPETKYVHIGHGIGPVAIKYNNDLHTFLNYKAIGFHGEHERSLYVEAGFPIEKSMILGSPFSTILLKQNTTDKIKTISTIGKSTWPTIIFAPTWNHGGENRGLFNFSKDEKEDAANVKMVCEFMKTHCINFVIRLHDKFRYSTDWLEKYKDIFIDNNVSYHYMDDQPDGENLFKYANVLIGDMSSVNTYFYIMDKPVIHIGSESFKIKRGYGVPVWDKTDRAGHIVDTLLDLFQAIDDSLAKPELFSDERKRVVKKYIDYIGDECKKQVLLEFRKIGK
jgi:CDP-glycerol glycerophosphotransferase (TagB/SpsB family)